MAASQVQTASGTGTSTSAAATWGSATTSGNTLIAHLCYRDSSATTPTAPSGWTLAGEVHASPNGLISMATYYAIEETSHSGTETWTIPNSRQWCVILEEYTGLHADISFDNCFFEAAAGLGASGDPVTVGADTQPGGSEGFAVCAFGVTRNATVADPFTNDPDGPQTFTYSNHAYRNVTAMAGLTSGWKEWTEWEMQQDACEMISAGGAGIAGSGIITIFKYNSTAIDNGTTSGDQYVKSAQASSTGAGNTLTATFSAGGTATAGNLLVALCAFRTPTTVPAVPSGWTEWPVGPLYGANTSDNTADDYIDVFYRAAAGGETGVTIDFQETGHRILLLIEADATVNLHQYAHTPDTTDQMFGDIYFSRQTGDAQTSNGFPLGPTGVTSAGWQVAWFVGDSTGSITSSTDQLGLMGTMTGLTNPSTTALKSMAFDRTTSTRGRAAVSASMSVTLVQDYIGVLLCFGPPLDEAGWAWHGSDPRWQMIA